MKRNLILVIIAVFVIMTVLSSCSYGEQQAPATTETFETISMDVPEMVTLEGQTMTMDEYVAGVVAAELQSWFHPETFRVFAIAARTNAVKQINSGKELINSTSFQCFYSQEELKEIYGDNFEDYYQKFMSAATSTHNMVIVDGNAKPIDALYHALSSGKTEDSKFVTGHEVSYLKGVESPWDKQCSDYQDIRFISYEKLEDMGFTNPKFKVLSYTDNGNVHMYEVCGEQYTATDLMYKLRLKSSAFEVAYKDEGIEFTTYGFGHGLGISSYGAEGMAKEGYTYLEIISYYYTDVRVVKY